MLELSRASPLSPAALTLLLRPPDGSSQSAGVTQRCHPGACGALLLSVPPGSVRPGYTLRRPGLPEDPAFNRAPAMQSYPPQPALHRRPRKWQAPVASIAPPRAPCRCPYVDCRNAQPLLLLAHVSFHVCAAPRPGVVLGVDSDDSALTKREAVRRKPRRCGSSCLYAPQGAGRCTRPPA